jgi:predicted dithiol-disulfide oxidoreductase (DUF899 family)
MVRIEEDYAFEGPDGKAALLDLFEGRRQLLLYHFMFGPNQEAGCDGCSMVIDQICHLAHLHARDTFFAAVSRARSRTVRPSASASSCATATASFAPTSPRSAASRASAPSGPCST